LRISRSNVPIVGLPSLSVLGNKNSLRQEAIPTSLSAVPHAAQQESRARLEVAVTVAAVTETEAMGQPPGRCSQ